MQRTVGVIGGSGLYEMPGLERKREIPTSSLPPAARAWGEPSDALVEGFLGETRLVFLPRHGRAHRIPPHRINYRANLLALKAAGAEQIVSVSAVGSLAEDVHPGDVVMVDQFIDRTRTRPSTFFEDVGVVAHVGFADPIDHALSGALHDAALACGARVHRGGTYVCIEGPQFSTRAESNHYRSWGGRVVGMTNLPEARLSRECELPYATVALVTDYDCWKVDEAAVTVDAVVAVLRKNVAMAQAILRAVADRLPDPSRSPSARALDDALLTHVEAITDEARGRLSLLLARVSKKA
ncbi:MAG: S-methyl-5'-thioadenosine phosphorylase [Deltaproteobacteria bacterium]